MLSELAKLPFPIIVSLDLPLLVRGRNEILICITLYLAPEEYSSLSLTCSELRTTLSSPHLIHSLFESVLVYCQKSGVEKVLTDLFVMGVEKQGYLDPLKCLGMLTFFAKQMFHSVDIIEDMYAGLLRTRENLNYGLFSEVEQYFFFHIKTGEFGEIGDDLRFSFTSPEKTLLNNENFKQYKLKSPKGREMDFLDRSCLEAMNLSLLPKKSLPHKLSPFFSYADIFLFQRNSRENYLQHITCDENHIVLFSFPDINSRIDIYYDWLFTRSVLRSVKGRMCK